MRYSLALLGITLLSGCSSEFRHSSDLDLRQIPDLSANLPRYAEVPSAEKSDHYEGSVVLVNVDYGSPRRLERLTDSPSSTTRAPRETLIESAEQMVQKLFGEYSLRLLHLRQGPQFNYATFQQTYQGLDVVGAKLVIRLDQAAEWTMSSSTLVHPALFAGLEFRSESSIDSTSFYPSAHRVMKTADVVYTRVLTEGNFEAFAAREFLIYDPATYQEIFFWVDKKKEALVGYQALNSAANMLQAKGSIVPNQPGDVATFEFFPKMTALLSDGSRVISSDEGAFDFELVERSQRGQEVKIYLENEHIVVANNEQARTGTVLDPTRIAEGALLIDEGPSLEERNIFFWVMRAKQFLKEKFNYTRSVGQLTAIARFGENFDNAFFMPGANILAFGAGYQLLKNTALSRDIIIHEFGHSMIQEMYGTVGGYEFSAMNEAMSDYLAAIVTNNPQVAEGAMQERTGMPYMRTVENTYVYPKDMTGKGFHVDGQIFSGALWTLRKSLGAEIADKLIHEAQLAQAKSIHEFYRELLAIDEDLSDRNPWTPSPNEAKIRQAFRAHGIGSADAVLREGPMKDYTIPWKRGCWSL